MAMGCFLLIILWLFASCTSPELQREEEVVNDFKTNGSISLSREAMERIAIKTQSPVLRTLSEKLSFRGYIEVPPENLHSIHAPIRGIVSEALLIEGDMVKKGQLLMKIKHPDIVKVQEEYAKLIAERAFMQKELERQEQLVLNEAASLKRVEEVKRDLDLLEASGKALESRLRLLSINPEQVRQGRITDEVTIHSPSDGSITRIAYNAGRLVLEDDFLLEIVDKKHLHLAMDIYEDQGEMLKKGQSIEFFLPGSDKVHLAELMLIGQMVDPVKRSILVHAHPLEDLDIFVPGMQVQGNVLLNENEYLSIPASSVFSTEDGKQIVFLQGSTDTFTWKELTSVRILGDYAIVDAQELSSAVVTEGAWYLFGLWSQ